MWSLRVLGTMCFRCWELIFRIGDVLEGNEVEGLHRREENRVVSQDLFNPLGMGTE